MAAALGQHPRLAHMDLKVREGRFRPVAACRTRGPWPSLAANEAVADVEMVELVMAMPPSKVLFDALALDAGARHGQRVLGRPARRRLEMAQAAVSAALWANSGGQQRPTRTMARPHGGAASANS
mmetsp:Transcript_32511/g.95151  ORF Transcript_32511/g.95151 Transcript_32511/m.95151 type:complete len:125 (+) Transcript_32511:1-375(+)